MKDLILLHIFALIIIGLMMLFVIGFSTFLFWDWFWDRESLFYMFRLWIAMSLVAGTLMAIMNTSNN